MADWKITLTIAEADIPEVSEAAAYDEGYQDTIEKQVEEKDILIEDGKITLPPVQYIANPESKRQFVERMLKRYLKERVKSWIAKQAAESARQTAIDDIENNLTIS